MLTQNVCLHLPGGHDIPATIPLEALQNIWTNYFIHTYDTADKMMGDYSIIFSRIYSGLKLREVIPIPDMCRLLIISRTKFEISLETFKQCNIVAITEKPPLLDTIQDAKIQHITPNLTFSTTKMAYLYHPGCNESANIEVSVNLWDLMKGERQCRIEWMADVCPILKDAIEHLASVQFVALNKILACHEDKIDDEENFIEDQLNVLLAANLHLSRVESSAFENDELVRSIATSYTNVYNFLQRSGKNMESFKLPFMKKEDKKDG